MSISRRLPKRAVRCMLTSPSRGIVARRTGICSYQAWSAAVRRVRILAASFLVVANVLDPIVADLVVVPGDAKRKACVGALEVGVALVERVLQAVPRKRGRFGAELLGHRDVAIAAVGIDAILVEIVAQMQHQVESSSARWR